ncbi:purine nucleoside permease [Halolamina salifodinae]|uniref:Purine nucleoside permease n=2 Tax=Halolamina salifodinae TaxID=1202767 RepID=A0A8T4GXL2_9EURY|nr:purine nucleoside permease [Halolamina salifodinae]
MTAFGPAVASDGSGELGRWIDGYGEFEREVSVPGAPTAIRVTDHGVGVTATGMGPTHAAASTTAYLLSDAVNPETTYFLTAGVAGVSPHAGTVGSVVLADHIVNWDAKKRYGKGTSVEPWGFGPAHAYELDRGLVDAAEDAARGVDLEDTPDARAHRERYTAAPAVDAPAIERGTSVAGADFWYGHTLANEVDSLVDYHGAGSYATTECEGFGSAVACDRFQALDRYLSVRAASNFDRPPQDEDAAGEWRLKGPAFRNAYRVGRVIADEIAKNWADWRDGPPDR